MSTTEDITREIGERLADIQEACRRYPTQPEGERKMTFASIRIAADAVATLADDAYAADVADDVRTAVNEIRAGVDELADRFGTDEPGRCGVCARPLATAALPGGDTLAYCAHCPQPIQDAVRDISDRCGADLL